MSGLEQATIAQIAVNVLLLLAVGYGAYLVVQRIQAGTEALEAQSEAQRLRLTNQIIETHTRELERKEGDLVRYRREVAELQRRNGAYQTCIAQCQQLLGDRFPCLPEQLVGQPAPKLGEFIFNAFTRGQMGDELLPKMSWSHGVSWSVGDFDAGSAGVLADAIAERARREGVEEQLIDILVELRPFRKHELGRS